MSAPPTPILTAALAYKARGWQPVALKPRSKAPVASGWQHSAHPAEVLPALFAKGENVGVLTGAPSGGLVDVDLDCPEAVALAPCFLPPTEATFGRPGKPCSHYLYAAPHTKTVKYQHPTARDTGDRKVMLVELRSTGGQTMMPPSAHPTGEQVRWDHEGPPASVDAATLIRACGQLAAAVLLVRHYPAEGLRHDFSLPFAGLLLGTLGWDDDSAAHFMRAVTEAAGDDDVPNRLEALATTRARLNAGEAVTGLPRCTELLGGAVMDTVVRWLGGLPKRSATASGPATYAATPGGMILRRMSEQGAVQETPLSNFAARITAERIDDDGVEQLSTFALEVRRGEGRLRTGDVPASEFASLGWVPKVGGPECILIPGPYTRDHLRAAIQAVSIPVPEDRRFTHTGWRDFGPGLGWGYLHADGAIGASGPLPGVAVGLVGPLAPFRLPPPPTDPRAALRASLRLLDVAPLPITVPLLAAVYRAPLGAADGSLAVVGPTGAGKSELVARAQQHFGRDFDARHLPASWASTANALEGLAFKAKDALLVVDDFSPGGALQERQKLHATADRLFRSTGNSSGRARMAADGSLRPVKPPRCLPCSTGEDLPNGQSVRGRMLIVEVGPEALDWRAMTRAQEDGGGGLYAAAMAGYLRWLAPEYLAMRASLADRVAALRTRAATGPQHKRTPDLVAQFGVGLRFLADYAVALGVWTAEEATARWEGWWRVLGEVAARQTVYQSGADPAKRFVGLLTQALASGAGHLTSLSGEAPLPEPDQWGWRLRPAEAGTRWEDGQYLDALGSPVQPFYQPQGPRLGWLDAERGHVLLLADAAYAAVQRLAREGTDGVTIGLHALKRRLHEAGLLAATEQRGGKEYLEVRRGIGGSRVTVLALPAGLFQSGGPADEEGTTP